MEQQRDDARILAEDEMASYGLHPAVHEELVRWHNPALQTPVATAHDRVRRRMRHTVEAAQPGADLKRSA